MSLYKHQPLQAPRKIRLISLEGSRSFKSPLRCTVSQAKLDGTAPFDALSYSWETLQGESAMSCDNGLLINITTNCELAIRHLRPKSGRRTLWIDAICTDQTSVADKNEQVPLMREIFSRAKEVIVWLGPEGKRSDRWLTMFRRYAEMSAYRKDSHEPSSSLQQHLIGLEMMISTLCF